MKLLHIKQIESSIPKLINTDLPIRIAYKLNIIIDDIEKHLVRLQKFRTEFLNKHGKPMEKEGLVEISKEKIQEFDEGMAELFDEEVSIEAVVIPLSILMDTNIKLTVLEIESLKNAGFLIDDINSNEE